MASQEGISQDQTVDPGIDQKLQTQTIMETLARLDVCSRLCELIVKAGSESALRRSGLRTLLAPTNEGLGGFAPEDLDAFLETQMLTGAMETFDLRRCGTVKSVSGRILEVKPEDGTFRVGRAKLVRSDIPCTNGVIHIVDGPVDG